MSLIENSSMGPADMVAQLEDMMDQANNEYERQMIQNEIMNIRRNNNMM